MEGRSLPWRDAGDGVRVALFGTAKLTCYPPGLQQPRHGHDEPHVSVLVAGSFREDGRVGPQTPAPAAVSYRPAGFAHELSFGPSGAVVLTLPGRNLDPAGRRSGWLETGAGAQVARLVRTAVRQLDAALGEELLWDVLAAGVAPPAAQPPTWLREARDRLLEEPLTSVQALAASVGRHRVHVSRMFRAAFGVSPSELKQRAMASRALQAVANGRPPVQAAWDAGYSDQSHMTRALVRFVGLPPARLGQRFR
ncbi:MAG TPA: AraC family transcriptional regulator [Phenylobacterium sp.]|nr:AraC family transcriptional regulator [Phenylobacterium sp.]